MIKAKEIEIKIQSRGDFFKEAEARIKNIEKGKFPKKGVRSVSFHNLEEVKKTLTLKRLELLHAVRRKKPASIYALAKLLGRETENVNRDVHLLEGLGFLELKKSKEKRKKLVPQTEFNEIKIAIPI